ncbi:hypothetical protein GCM10010987_79710 [Bradyrhizobium guangdongense]|uniref:Uncharacterized protein n=1 Tax=Bradyrhizobium guangdongense TaxID=1325090 RepID=A0AA87WH52_9BRAD|nr:hypothetical protein GCM10010987_79710 [Bradyrhizobium guangdongense]
MIGFAAQRLMELEVEGQVGAAYGEKNPERLAQRNGELRPDLGDLAGTVELRIPSCARAPTSRVSWSRAGWPRRRSPPWSVDSEVIARTVPI